MLQTRNREVSGLNPWELTVCAAFSGSYRRVWAMSGFYDVKSALAKVTLVFTNLNLWG